MRNIGWRRDDHKAKAVALYREHDLSTAQIAERFGVSQDTVRIALREAGIPCRPIRRSFASTASVSMLSRRQPARVT